MESRCRRISGSTPSATSEFSRRLSLARIFWVRIVPSRIRVEGILLRRVSSPTTSAANSVCCGSKAGTDLASITDKGFAALRLDEIVALRERHAVDDAAMVDYLLRCALAPNQPRPSIETLLHAFIPAAHIDHTHPDAIIALTSSPEGRSLADEAFGSDAVWLDYQRPGFDMSKRIAELLEANPAARAVLLDRHGLVTWGDTSEEAYRST